MVNQVHGLYAVEIGETTPFTIPGIQSNTISSNTTVRGDVTDGQVSPEFQSIVAQNPRINFATMAIGIALTKVGLQSYIVNPTAVPTGFNAFARKHLIGSTRVPDATSDHRKYQANNGMIVPGVLTCDHQGDAVLPFDMVAIYDGTNAPVVVTDGEIIPATLLTGFDERYGLGPVILGGTTITGVKSVSIDFGVGAVVESADGDIWPSFVNVREKNPVITIEGIDVDWLTDTLGTGGAVNPLGTALLQSTSEIYLRKRLDSSTFESSASAVHPHFTFAGIATADPFMAVGGSDAGTVGLRLTLRRDPQNAPRRFNLAALP